MQINCACVHVYSCSILDPGCILAEDTLGIGDRVGIGNRVQICAGNKAPDAPAHVSDNPDVHYLKAQRQSLAADSVAPLLTPS